MPENVRGSRGARSSGSRELGPDFAWGAFVYLSLGEDADKARRRGDEHLAWRYDEPRFTGDLAGKYLVAGDADACVAGLLDFAAAGCTHVILSLVRRQGESPSAALEAVAESILPGLRGRPTAS